MKIAILVKVFPPSSIGGTEIATSNIAKNLAKNHDVNVITIRKENLPKQEDIDNYNLHRLSISDIPIINHFIYFLKILLKLKKIKPDIIHVQMLYSEALFSIFIKKLLTKPVVVSPRGTDIYLSSNLYKKTFIKFILKNSDCILAQTNNQKIEIEKYSKNDIIIIPNGIDSTEYNFNKTDMRLEMGFKSDDYLIIFIGRLHKVKGVEYLINAMKLIENSKIDNLKLLIIGDGTEKRKLKQLSNELKLDNISFLGSISQKEIPRYLISSDIFVLPSLSEGFPVSIMEAFASGLPIIVSNVGGIPEIVENKVNGFIVEPKNSNQIANKINDLINDENMRIKISHNNKKKAVEFSWEKIIKRIEKAYIKAQEKIK